MVYATEDFLLLVWIRSGDGDGIDSWVLQDIIRLRAEMDQFTTTPWQWEGQVEVVQVRFGCVYLCMTSITAAGTQRSSFFYLSLETMEIELLIHGTSGDSAYPYIMAWPPCLVGDDRRTEHEVEGSCSCLLKSSNYTKKRKSSSLKETSPVGLATDFNSVDVVRQPLSPLQPKSPDCRVHKK
ncbi:uncharacterized protein LOC125530551 isoform X2 [Triticum urartu]|uniref:uncharacterized protein LOC125530551 isoform X2 n=1 Tax=Triticum urartu TaxID=4572 RepID=UPI002043395A|nr:uncharacterized protein LOC125530551 isoform X2 [Triticum urartu]